MDQWTSGPMNQCQLPMPRLLNAGARKGMELVRVEIGERPKEVRRPELRSNPINTEVVEEEGEEGMALWLP